MILLFTIKNSKVKRPLVEKNMFGARIKIMWEEQLVETLITI